MTTAGSGVSPGRHRDLRAAGWMLASVLVNSFIPPLLVGSGGSVSPFFFNLFFSVGVFAGCLLFLALCCGPALFNRAVLRLILRRVFCWPVFWSFINGLNFTLFTLSSQFVDGAVATVLRGTWPLFFIVAMASLFQGQRRYRNNLGSVLPLGVFALAGFGYTVASQGGGLELAGSSDLAVGFAFGIGAALAAGVGTAYAFRWGVELAGSLSAFCRCSERSLLLFGTTLGFAPGFLGAALANFLLLVSPLNAAFGLSFSAAAGRSWTLQFGSAGDLRLPLAAAGFLGGFLFNAGGAVLLRAANLATDNLGVNALSYGVPLAALVWLGLFLSIGVARVDYLLIGAAAIVAANLLVNFSAARLAGVKGLALGLWVAGMLAYLEMSW